ncbi:uncharacterized protein LOC122379464 isoform X2 [Amphibalanus amphitrite]|uniref:uncharacterized protein LOC122379464 isoform X2 n=1 Tax=Amphibalanus amphitrite TaxID=1232801 RepID=UPI001C90D9B2|nr:uncharacterized protein LOC122379464 isoform X2 [Amphibalanus amphitrite]
MSILILLRMVIKQTSYVKVLSGRLQGATAKQERAAAWREVLQLAKSLGFADDATSARSFKKAFVGNVVRASRAARDKCRRTDVSGGRHLDELDELALAFHGSEADNAVKPGAVSSLGPSPSQEPAAPAAEPESHELYPVIDCEDGGVESQGTGVEGERVIGEEERVIEEVDVGTGHGRGAPERQPTASGSREEARAAFEELMSRDESELLDHERPKVKAILQNMLLRELLVKVQRDDTFSFLLTQ